MSIVRRVVCPSGARASKKRAGTGRCLHSGRAVAGGGRNPGCHFLEQPPEEARSSAKGWRKKDGGAGYEASRASARAKVFFSKSPAEWVILIP